MSAEHLSVDGATLDAGQSGNSEKASRLGQAVLLLQELSGTGILLRAELYPGGGFLMIEGRLDKLEAGMLERLRLFQQEIIDILRATKPFECCIFDQPMPHELEFGHSGWVAGGLGKTFQQPTGDFGDLTVVG